MIRKLNRDGMTETRNEGRWRRIQTAKPDSWSDEAQALMIPSVAPTNTQLIGVTVQPLVSPRYIVYAIQASGIMSDTCSFFAPYGKFN